MRKLAGFILILLGLGVGVQGTVGADAGSNSASYWTNYGPHPAECFKHDFSVGSHAHGTSNGTSVTLNAFQQSWPGDHWELLVIKGGSDNNGGGDNVIVHPSAGVAYFPPLNPQSGKTFGVSHWIACKGTTPQTTTTTTTVPETTTTTTVVETTTTTTQPEETTTTTVPEETTTTTVPEVTTTTTTQPEETTTTTTEPVVTTTTDPEDPTTTTTTTVPPVVPVVGTDAPTFVDPTCSDPTLAIWVADTVGVEYNVTGSAVPGGTATVTAVASPGFVLDPNAQTVWTHTFPATDPACVPTIPVTGSNSGQLILLALTLIGIGAVMLRFAAKH